MTGRVGPEVVVGYIRVSTDEQGERGLGLAAQEATIRAECDRRGWRLLEPVRVDVASGKSRARRPQLADALDLVRDGDAGTLMVAKLDRLSRSLLDFATITAEAREGGWNLVALDLGVDLTSPAGEVLAGVMAVFAQWERRIIGERTKAALGELQKQGVALGRSITVPETVRAGIIEARAAGKSYQAIANDLNAGAVPTGQGGRKWYAATVRAVEHRATATTTKGARDAG